MQGYDITSVEMSAIVHATEDIEKVRKAMENVVGSEDCGFLHFSRQRLKGHHGNPIMTLRATLTDSEMCRRLVGRIFKTLQRMDQAALSKSLPDRFREDGSLYLRLDKQAAFLGSLKLKDEDSIRIRARFVFPHLSEDCLRDICTELGLQC